MLFLLFFVMDVLLNMLMVFLCVVLVLWVLFGSCSLIFCCWSVCLVCWFCLCLLCKGVGLVGDFVCVFVMCGSCCWMIGFWVYVWLWLGWLILCGLLWWLVFWLFGLFVVLDSCFVWLGNGFGMCGRMCWIWFCLCLDVSWLWLLCGWCLCCLGLLVCWGCCCRMYRILCWVFVCVLFLWVVWGCCFSCWLWWCLCCWCGFLWYMVRNFWFGWLGGICCLWLLCLGVVWLVFVVWGCWCCGWSCSFGLVDRFCVVCDCVLLCLWVWLFVCWYVYWSGNVRNCNVCWLVLDCWLNSLGIVFGCLDCVCLVCWVLWWVWLWWLSCCFVWWSWYGGWLLCVIVWVFFLGCFCCWVWWVWVDVCYCVVLCCLLCWFVWYWNVGCVWLLFLCLWMVLIFFWLVWFVLVCYW